MVFEQDALPQPAAAGGQGGAAMPMPAAQQPAEPVSILAYLDDVVIMVKADDMPLAIHSLTEEAACIGLQLRADKCLVYNQDEAEAQALATEVQCEATGAASQSPSKAAEMHVALHTR
jgi:hypothetical protein